MIHSLYTEIFAIVKPVLSLAVQGSLKVPSATIFALKVQNLDYLVVQGFSPSSEIMKLVLMQKMQPCLPCKKYFNVWTNSR
jgi:hypothetical protein